jgi:hypothetical protein
VTRSAVPVRLLGMPVASSAQITRTGMPMENADVWKDGLEQIAACMLGFATRFARLGVLGRFPLNEYRV